MSTVNRDKITTITLLFFTFVFVVIFIFTKFFVIRPLQKEFDAKDQVIEELRGLQKNQGELLGQIDLYRDGLYALNLLLEARKNVISGYDDENPYLVYNFAQVLDDLRRLLPKDARVTKFQINNKGLITIPIESVDYASLGRVLKSFKDKSYNVKDDDSEEKQDPKMFTEVKIPSGAQRSKKLVQIGWRRYFNNIYSFTLQAKLRPEFWQNPMPYPDVNPHVYYADAVRDLTIAAVIEGYPDGYFKPNNSMNRAEFFKVALFEFLSNDQITIDEYKKYIDLSERDWHYQYIQLASKMGIAEGDDVDKFHPNQTLTRIEALKTILTIFNVPIEGDPEEDPKDKKPIILPFRDIKPTDDVYPVVRTAIKNGLLGNIEKTLKPNQHVTRAEVTYWVWKLKFDYLNK